MHIGALGARRQIAETRITAAVKTLIELYEIDPALLARLEGVREKDRAVTAMKKLEVIADILEAVAAVEPIMAELHVTDDIDDDFTVDVAASFEPEVEPEPEQPRRGKGKK